MLFAGLVSVVGQGNTNFAAQGIDRSGGGNRQIISQVAANSADVSQAVVVRDSALVGIVFPLI